MERNFPRRSKTETLESYLDAWARLMEAEVNSLINHMMIQDQHRPILGPEDVALLRAERTLPTSEIESVIEARVREHEWPENMRREVALRLIFRTYFVNYFLLEKSELISNTSEGNPTLSKWLSEPPDYSLGTDMRMFLLVIPKLTLLVEEYFTRAVESFIALFDYLVDKAVSGA